MSAPTGSVALRMSMTLAPMSPILGVTVTVVLAGALVLLGVPVVEWIARSRGWIDAPTDERWHEEATPHLGGAALLAGVGTAVWTTGAGSVFAPGVWFGAVVLFVVGLADDLSPLAPAAKLVAQLVATALVLWAGLSLLPGHSLWLAGPLTALWVLGLTNALNLLDSMDGVAAGVSAVAAAALAIVAGVQGQWGVVVVGTGVSAAAGAFLVYNSAPARIFMGDGGSLPLGYLLAVLGLAVLRPPHGESSLAVPVVALCVPLLDTTFVSVTRLGRGQSVSEGGVDHLAHRLVRLGWAESQAAPLLWGAGAVGGAIAVVGATGPRVLFWGLVVAAVGLATGLAVLLGRYTSAAPR